MKFTKHGTKVLFGNFTKYYADNDTCLASKRPNATAISNVYEGIPETILLNIIAWIVLIVLFAILRNRAWDYGRLALVHTEKWTQLFYKNTDDAIPAIDNSNVSLITDTGCLWFPSIFKIKRDMIYARCGPDASHYLSFQEHLLQLAATITVFSIGVILPIDFQGKLQGGKTTFGHTTLSNLEPDSCWLWVHVVACFSFVPLTIMIMRKCSGRMSNGTALTSRTLMVTHISRHHRNAEDIKNYFSVRYPGLEIKDVQIAHKVKKLMELEKRREVAHEAKTYCIVNRKNKPGLKVQPRGCVVCCPWKTQLAEDYYAREEEELTALVMAERKKSLENPLGIAFVTVNSEEIAQHIMKTFKPGSLRHWFITMAPLPSDINWENLELSYKHWYSKAILINVTLFFVLFFLTTPLVVVDIFNNLTARDNFIKKISPLLSEFLPTLLLLSMSALMPVMVAFSDEWMSHWTKSKQNHATMYKTFLFLLFMVLILPSLGLTSAQAFLEWSIHTDNITLRWECIFLADKGAFFVNYVITAALIGTALELLRFPELAIYAFRLLCIRSEAEKTSIRKEILCEFRFGIHYAWTLMIFTIMTVYSLTCPLITPFGLLYLILKHLVDKYNIYYVYKPITMCGEGQHIHSDAVRMVRVAVILLQLTITVFSFIRGGFNAMSTISFIGFFVTLSFFLFFNPFSSSPESSQHSDLPRTNEQYIAPVLLTSQNIEQSEDCAVSSTSSGDSSNLNEVDIQLAPEIEPKIT